MSAFCFKVGDVVKVKSGGPEMTITELDDVNASCSWSDHGDFRSSSFPLACLRPTLAYMIANLFKSF